MVPLPLDLKTDSSLFLAVETRNRNLKEFGNGIGTGLCLRARTRNGIQIPSVKWIGIGIPGESLRAIIDRRLNFLFIMTVISSVSLTLQHKCMVLKKKII